MPQTSDLLILVSTDNISQTAAILVNHLSCAVLLLLAIELAQGKHIEGYAVRFRSR